MLAPVMSPSPPSTARAASIRDSNVAVVTVNYRTPGLTKRCIAALAKERKRLPWLRAVVVDGGSGDGSAAELAEALAHPDYAGWVEFLPLPINGGFGWANNQAMLSLARQEKPPEFIHLLNPDTEVMPGAVGALVDELRANPRSGAAGSQLIDGQGQPVGSAFRFPSPGRELTGNARSEKLGRLLGIDSLVVWSPSSVEVDWVTGASVMLRSEALRECGLFDDGFFLYFEEVELMHRMRDHGWTVRHVPQSRVAHVEGAATGISAAATGRTLPDYWYDSRRRYFALTGNRFTLMAANALGLAGLGISAAKRAVGRRPLREGPRAWSLVRSVSPTFGTVQPAIVRWSDPAGSPPAWMARR